VEEALRKANFCFDQNKNKREIVPSWKSKNTNNFEQRRRDLEQTKMLTIKGIIRRIII